MISTVKSSIHGHVASAYHVAPVTVSFFKQDGTLHPEGARLKTSAQAPVDSGVSVVHKHVDAGHYTDIELP